MIGLVSGAYGCSIHNNVGWVNQDRFPLIGRVCGDGYSSFGSEQIVEQKKWKPEGTIGVFRQTNLKIAYNLPIKRFLIDRCGFLLSDSFSTLFKKVPAIRQRPSAIIDWKTGGSCKLATKQQ